ncbi:MAG: hypothetical protein ACKOC8_01015 [Pirellulales bacterium]
MLRTLRTLLVAAAAAATILAGFRELLAEVWPADPTIHAIDAAALDGSREDDSGTRPEQAEEDDRDEQEDRELHLFATTVLACDLGSTVAFAAPTTRSTVVRVPGRTDRVRGPPTIG